MRCRLKHLWTNEYFDGYQCQACHSSYRVPKGQICRRRCRLTRRQHADRFVLFDEHAGLWKFFYLTVDEQLRFSEPLQMDAPDGTRIGTWLSAFFKKLGYEPAEGCYCNQLASTLDQASWNLIASNKKLVTEMILQSAAKMKKRPLRVNVRFALELALLRNKPKRDLRGDGSSSLQV